jgi:hypothetical protein
VVPVAGKKDVVAYELAALKSQHNVPLKSVVLGCPHHRAPSNFIAVNRVIPPENG